MEVPGSIATSNNEASFHVISDHTAASSFDIATEPIRRLFRDGLSRHGNPLERLLLEKGSRVLEDGTIRL